MRHNAAVFLTMTSTAERATDLGFLLHKHPDRFQEVSLSFGKAAIFFPEAGPDRCTMAIMVEVDHAERRRRGDFALAPYVNPSAYAASSMLAVALRRVFGTAMNRRCDARPELVDRTLPLTIELPTVPADDHDLPRRLFEPLGWQVRTETAPLDPQIPRWGEAPYVALRLDGRQTVADTLLQLYVLLPVLGGRKHYWVGPEEVDKLLRSAQDWLGGHPERELIMNRYLAFRHGYVEDASTRLDGIPEPVEGPKIPEPVEGQPTLAHGRATAVLQVLAAVGAHRVVDLGCGEGALLTRLAAEPSITEILGVDPSAPALERARRRLATAPLADRQRDAVRLRQSSAVYRDNELAGFDAIVLMEVIEHLDPDRVGDLERVVFGSARPGTVIVTTPDRSANADYPGLAAGALRHPDHRFEWDREEFAHWVGAVADRYGYRHQLDGIGPEGRTGAGGPSQLAIFHRVDQEAAR
ncbi:3' terminal RNA ribose 2'-O-methyltransferase Hen1 [Microlunatus soli]|uniref:Small RNA 2'-O-methyltransferase n=1 Tax=Microlunatus soli TaxID=630515 RepID=A0A1H1X8D6_9ACTN|nr:3' terminal RNA ribose 2'-O-methyltransferase Hen1 [Microlunatus soli]SDT04926.1 3' terminal RNA ribose 2'-O-methyltransferase Hen1 [Microlunatus soli]